MNSVFLVASEGITPSGVAMKIILRAALVASMLAIAAMTTAASAQCAPPQMGVNAVHTCDPSARTVVKLVVADAGDTPEMQRAAGALQTALVHTASPQFTFVQSDTPRHAITATLYPGVPSTDPTITIGISADFVAQNGSKAASKSICRMPIGTFSGGRAIYPPNTPDTTECVTAFITALTKFAKETGGAILRTPIRFLSASATTEENALVAALNMALQSSTNFVELASGGNPHDAIVVTITKGGIMGNGARLRYAVQLSGTAGTTITSAECPPNALDGCVAEVMQAAVAYQTTMRQSGR